MSFIDKMKNMFFGEEYEDDYEDEDDYSEGHREDIRPSISSNVTSIDQYSSKRGTSNIVNINTSVQMSVCMFNPKSLEEASEAVLQIQSKNIVVTNLEGLEYQMSQRISDFLCGASYALECNVQLISDEIMIIVPNNVEMSGELKDKLQATGIKIPNSSWR